jgi:hypothetical protein
MGGQYQSTGHVDFLSKVFDLGLDIQERPTRRAPSRPRGRLQLEPTFAPDVVEDLRRRGHEIEVVDSPIGGCQAIMIDHERGALFGASTTARTASRSGSDRDRHLLSLPAVPALDRSLAEALRAKSTARRSPRDRSAGSRTSRSGLGSSRARPNRVPTGLRSWSSPATMA